MRLKRIEEISIHSFILNTILVIDVDRTFLNEYGRLTVSTFGISIHHSNISYYTRKSYITRLIETRSFRSDRC